MKKRKDFLKELKHTVERRTKELRSFYKETKKEILDDSEKEFLDSLVGKYLVIEREKFTGYYGMIKSAESNFYLCEDVIIVKYTIKVNYEKEGKINSTYIDPLKEDTYKLFKTEKEAKNCIEKKKK